MAHLAIISKIDANPDLLQLIKAELEKPAPITHAEAYGIQDELYQDNDNLEYFMVYNSLESCKLWQAQLNTPHLDANREAAKGAVTKFIVNEMTLIN